MVPTTEPTGRRSKHFLDQAHDVTVNDVQLAAREGYQSIEHAKRYTTLGMAPDQGKTGNIIGMAIMADLLDKDNEYILLSVKSNLLNTFLPIKLIKITAIKTIALNIRVDFLLFSFIISIFYLIKPGL